MSFISEKSRDKMHDRTIKEIWNLFDTKEETEVNLLVKDIKLN